MKLSKSTLSVLKSFANINLNFCFKEGNIITTNNAVNSIIAEVEVEESFDRMFGIYDLSRFLGVIGLYNDPDIEFDDKKAVITEGKYSTIFYGAEPEILSYPKKSIKFPDVDVEFTLATSDFEKAMKAANILSCDTFTFEGDGKTINLVVSDPKVDGSNKFSLEIGETDKVFSAHIKIENMKLLPLDYEVSISKKKIARFSSDEGKVVYYAGLAATSTFE